MKILSPLRWCGAAAALLLASCGNSLSTSGSSTASKEDLALADSLHRKVNEYRSSIGRPPLARHRGLDQMAQAHAEFLKKNRGKFQFEGKNLSHFGFEERVVYAQRAMQMQSLAENVAAGEKIGAGSVGALLTAWSKSEKHSYNLRNSWNATGIGVAIDQDGSVFATQIFATRNHSPMAMTERFR